MSGILLSQESICDFLMVCFFCRPPCFTFVQQDRLGVWVEQMKSVCALGWGGLSRGSWGFVNGGLAFSSAAFSLHVPSSLFVHVDASMPEGLHLFQIVVVKLWPSGRGDLQDLGFLGWIFRRRRPLSCIGCQLCERCWFTVEGVIQSKTCSSLRLTEKTVSVSEDCGCIIYSFSFEASFLWEFKVHSLFALNLFNSLNLIHFCILCKRCQALFL